MDGTLGLANGTPDVAERALNDDAKQGGRLGRPRQRAPYANRTPCPDARRSAFGDGSGGWVSLFVCDKVVAMRLPKPEHSPSKTCGLVP